ncbi:hypothetical protein PQR34_36970 [Paraburkholderia sediminicola]|uniref:hypothetical protein n=1 Tax=Paraburkholderia sediminicola TaxID=458836 RepID=UPI0038BAAE3A
MHHYRNCAGNPLSRGFEPLSLAYFSLRRQREVGAAPHRGNANRPLRNQGKANAVGTPTKRRAGKQTKKNPNAAGTPKPSAAQAKTKNKPLLLRRPIRRPNRRIHIPIIKFRRCHNMLLRKECKTQTAIKIYFGKQIIAAY